MICSNSLRARLLTGARALFVMLALGSASSSPARIVLIDFDAGSVPNSGQSFSSDTSHCGAADTAPSSCRVNIFGDKNAGPFKLGFTIRIGNSNFSQFYLNEAGIMTFTAALSSPGAFQPVTGFAALRTRVGQPFVSAFYANLQAPDDDGGGPFSVANGGVIYQGGMADPTQPYSTSGLLKALGVVWMEDGSFFPSVGTQVVIYFTGKLNDTDATNDGDFAVRIRYGRDDLDAYNSPDMPQGIAGFQIGSSSHELSAPLRAADDYFFRFHNGSFDPNSVFRLIPAMGSDFGNQPLNVLKRRNYTLTNMSGAPLAVEGMEFTGPDAALFSFPDLTLIQACNSPIPVGGNCQFAVGFRATTVGAKTANLRVVLPGYADLSRFMRGTGVLTVFTASPASLAFGNVRRNTTSAAKAVTVRNTGTVEMPIGTISFTGTHANQFTQTHNCPTTLATGASCVVSVRFRPTSTGAKSASLRIAPGGGATAKSIPLTGTGIN